MSLFSGFLRPLGLKMEWNKKLKDLIFAFLKLLLSFLHQLSFYKITDRLTDHKNNNNNNLLFYSSASVRMTSKKFENTVRSFQLHIYGIKIYHRLYLSYFLSGAVFLWFNKVDNSVDPAKFTGSLRIHIWKELWCGCVTTNHTLIESLSSLTFLLDSQCV